MKRKILFYIIAGILSAIFFVVLYKWFFNQPCKVPEKSDNVPRSAVWKGDCDEGQWIELVSMREDTCRFRIYQDYDGSLILDADFYYVDCENFRLTKDNWVEHIAYFGNTLELYDKSNPNKRCYLAPIYPPYYDAYSLVTVKNQ